jgi:hypothetical protein
MKHLIAALLFFVLAFSVQAQTNLRTVMVGTNGVVQRPTNFITTNRIVSVETNGTVANPTNFWTANSNSINSVVASIASTNNQIFNRTVSSMADLSTDTVNGIATIGNSIAIANIAATNSSGKVAIRLIRDVNSLANAGVGTQFGSDSHTFWTRIEAVPRSGNVRAILGNTVGGTTNIAEYPTNRAIGFELRSLSASATNEVRLIAHNGTTNTNGPWVTIGDIYQRYWIGVEQNKTNGEVKLYVGVNAATPTNNTNATISGGPTNNASTAQSSFDAGIFTTNTNSGAIGLNVYSAFVDVID